MDIEEFEKQGHRLVNWIAEYFRHIEEYPVKSRARPGEIKKQLPKDPPEKGEDFNGIFRDFKHIILPGITHWQSPNFFAYFNANNSCPSILAEMLTAALGAQCMSWQTSPAATELEERVMKWLGKAMGLPEDFHGVIQDTASTATLCSLLTAREKKSGFRINRRGLADPRWGIYCSEHAHSSIEKAVRITGLGSRSIRRIPVNRAFAMKPESLKEAVEKDLNRGIRPLAVVAAVGTTSSAAVDPLKAIAVICREFGVWLHVDAAYAGTALLLPEYRRIIAGIEDVDTFVFNPHKWMFTNFDCSAYFVKDREALIRTFSILPEYLRTREDRQVNNYRDWGIQLGRRFRALKLWFVIRSYGLEGLREKVRNHVEWAGELAEEIRDTPDFELLAPVFLGVVCFRYRPKGVRASRLLDQWNRRLLETVNEGGQVYITHTELNGRYTLRFVVGQTSQRREHVRKGWRHIRDIARELSAG